MRSSRSTSSHGSPVRDRSWVELVSYPRSTHDLSRTGEPWLLVDRLERIRSWLDHWLNAKKGAAGTP